MARFRSFCTRFWLCDLLCKWLDNHLLLDGLKKMDLEFWTFKNKTILDWTCFDSVTHVHLILLNVLSLLMCLFSQVVLEFKFYC